jgi:hypothetical protein
LRIAFLLEVFGSLVMVPLTVRRGPSVRISLKGGYLRTGLSLESTL